MNICITDCDSTLMKEEMLDCIAEHAGVSKEIEALTNAQMNGESRLSFRENLEKRIDILVQCGKKVSKNDLHRLSAQHIHFSVGAKEFISFVLEQCGTLKNQFYIFSGGFIDIITLKISELDIPHDQKEILVAQTWSNAFSYDENEYINGVDWSKSFMWEKNAKNKKTLELIHAGHISPHSTIIGVGDGSNDIGIVPQEHGTFVGFVGNVHRQAIVDSCNGHLVHDFFELKKYFPLSSSQIRHNNTV